jgi:hypothetical protein
MLMSDQPKPVCPDCEEGLQQPTVVDRRNFIRILAEHTGAAVAVGTMAGTAPNLLAATAAVQQPTRGRGTPRPAEALIYELYSMLTADQRRLIVHPWNEGAENGRGIPRRHGMYNAAMGGNGRRIGDVYTRPQQELLQRIFRAIASDEDGHRQLTRGGTFDNSGSFTNCGADIFGEAVEGRQFSWVFTGHHLTVRCDGNSDPDVAFGGPLYYGHSPDGYSERNIFYYQTRAVLSVYDALTEAQRRAAVVVGTPGEHAPSVRFRSAGEAHPGVRCAELNQEQRVLIERVMREILAPYRREDADEVMEIVRRNGGMEQIHLAFYRDRGADENARWHFWRLEGPGFVWNYRVLPHVHCYVNISARV